MVDVGIFALMDEQLPFSVDTVFKTCWLPAVGFGDFLLGEGDLDLSYDEWVPNAVSPPEDITKMGFNFSRNFSFEHPRTTMLFIGPKNAPARQVQYLYTGGQELSDINKWSPNQLIIITVSKFEGFPFANTFKVSNFPLFTLKFSCYDVEGGAILGGDAAAFRPE